MKITDYEITGFNSDRRGIIPGHGHAGPDGLRQKVLVAYFSHSGNTREMARQIAEATNGDLFEIVPQSAYPAQYDAVMAQAKREIGRGYRPALKGACPTSAHTT